MNRLFRRNKKRTQKESPNNPNTQQTLASPPAAAEIPSTFDNAKNTDNESQRTMAAPQTTSVVAGTTVAVFSNSRDIHITGNPSFHTTPVINTSNGPSWEALNNALRERAAPNAILNVGGRADEVRCHPGTREEVISKIETWANAPNGQTDRVFWLSGPAGAGKSAIMQTIAERCKERGEPHANFFFFRNDSSRDHASPVIATLLHQIILLYPSLRDTVATVLSNDPLLLDSTLNDQLEKLIVTPLRSIFQLSSTPHPLLLLIDGLDECDSETKHSQTQILRAFDKVLAQYAGACPIRVLLASRDEPQIRVAFKKLASQCVCLYLNDEYSPESDIRVFVNAQFQEVRDTHSLAHLLDVDWPSIDDVNYIVEKSSGQFIYAATVMRFILGSSASPMVSLDRVRGVTQRTTKSPFSYLDVIYAHILSQVEDQDALRNILSTHLLFGEVQRSHMQHYQAWEQMIGYDLGETFMELLTFLNLRYTNAIVRSCLEDLTSLVKYDSGKLVLHHASFSDYLSDQARSGDYFINTMTFSYKLLHEIWKVPGDRICDGDFWIVFGLEAMTQLAKLPAGVMGSMISSMRSTGTVVVLTDGLLSILREIQSLCICSDDTVDFRHFLCLLLDRQDKQAFSYNDVHTEKIKAMLLQLGDVETQATQGNEKDAKQD